MTSLKTNDGLQKLLAGLLVLFMADTIIGGSIGLFFRGERHLILALTVIVASYLCFDLWHENRVAVASLQKRFLWPLGFFLISMVWVLPVPIFTTGDIAMALRDAQSLILLPVATLLLYAIADLENAIKRFFKIVVALSICLAIFQLTLWLWLELQLTPTDIPTLILEAVFKNSPSIFAYWAGAHGVGYVRVLWVSSLWLIVAIFVAPLVVKGKWLFPIELVLGMAIHVSYTRGIWLGVAVGVLFCTAANYITRVLGKRSLMPIKNWVVVVFGLIFAPIVISTQKCPEI